MMLLVAGRVLSAEVRPSKDGATVAVAEVDTPAGLVVCGVKDAPEYLGPEVGRFGFFTVTQFFGRKEGALYVFGEWLPKAPNLVEMAASVILTGEVLNG